MDKATEIFEKHRQYLYRLAYNMLGRVTVAEDMVQESYLKWKKVDLNTVSKPKAYLSSIVANLCIDQLRSARQQREKYIGPDLPEPIITEDKDSPEEKVQLADALSFAVLYMLQKLNPLQRAVFILREVFNYPYSDIADIINKTETNCRKIAQRARDQFKHESTRSKTDRKKHQELLKSFMDAVQKEDVGRLESYLAQKATLYSDGGGEVTAARRPIFGGNNIARFMVGIKENTPENLNIEYTIINGDQGFLVWFGTQLHSAWTFQISDSTIKKIFTVSNPDKLKHIRPNGQ